MVRVGFTFEMTGAWIGGANYFRSLIAAVLALPDRAIDPVIFAAQEDAVGLSAQFPGISIVPTRLFTRRSMPWLTRKLTLRATGRDTVLHDLLRKHGVDVLSHSGCLGPGATIPAIGWIADLQHRRLPALCSARESAARDATIERWHRFCAALVFSSHAARADFARFYGEAAIPAYVIPFVPLTHPVPAAAATEAFARYALPRAYFYVPNQFWVHKNHRIVIEAARRLGKAGLEVDLVFTGGTQDYRDGGHYDGLKALAADLGSHARFLGIVPYADVLALMEGALAIINPSRFEGWSTTVEEARNLGKSILLSDIDVHREQAPPRAVYFNPDDADDLAARMRTAWTSMDASREKTLRAQHTPDVMARRRAFGAAFEHAVLEVHSAHAATKNPVRAIR